MGRRDEDWNDQIVGQSLEATLFSARAVFWLRLKMGSVIVQGPGRKETFRGRKET